MIETLRTLLRRPPKRALPMIPRGERVYAIGDVHGQLDLLTALLGRIDTDQASRPAARTTIILLGDLVDRGPDSAGIITALREWRKTRRIRILCGNHEEMFLRAFDDLEAVAPFLRYGGLETLTSYGLAGDALRDADPATVQALMRSAVPASDLAFLDALENTILIGNYLFVHAGIRPGVPLDGQCTDDLRWIREPFLSHAADYAFVVVHGHTIANDPEVRGNRIGIDTGAYISGRLTALGLEGAERWFIQTSPADRAPASAPA